MTMRDLINFDRPFNLPVRQADMRATFDNLQNEMNRIFDHLYSGALVRMTDWDKKLQSAPAVDVKDTGKSFKVKIELAGMDPENVDLEISEGVLTIKGEKKEEKKDEGENYLRQEISYGSFYRTVALPPTADSEKADAKYKGGVLTVEVPKKADASKASKKLQIKKAA